MRLFDSHAHINDEIYEEDFDQMLMRATEAGVEAIMIAGVTLETVLKALEIATKPRHSLKIFISVGMHPHDAQYCTEDIVSRFKEIARNNPDIVKGWGEIGLDFNRMHSPKEIQEKWLLSQMEAAEELSLPMIFHERDSDGRFLQILESMKSVDRSGVIHCFSGTKQEMFRYLDLGYHIGITGILTIKQRGELLRSLATLIPEERMVIETDAPYLAPVPMRNKTRRNEPAFVRYVALKLAEIRDIDHDSIAETLWNNTCSLYRTVE